MNKDEFVEKARDLFYIPFFDDKGNLINCENISGNQFVRVFVNFDFFKRTTTSFEIGTAGTRIGVGDADAYILDLQNAKKFIKLAEEFVGGA